MIIEALLAISAFVATIVAVFSNKETSINSDGKLNRFAAVSVILAVVVLAASLFKAYSNLIATESLNNDLASATEELLSIERLVFDETVRFGGGNELIWDGPDRIPGGSTVRILGYPMELNFYYGGRSTIVVPESATTPRFVYIHGSPGSVAYDWAIAVKDEPESKRFFEMGNVSVYSTYELGEWKSSRDVVAK
ncbi:hypothetical protein [Vibrio rotiferianus]|uniref:hypothetical protein n=1 Tax=Vibrio rotiferianus TaxID=190895 RepID=UPI0011136723|nr:hypothetical protein [Vibrio rotiferianus]